MIIALLSSGVPVQVEDADNGTAIVSAIGRNKIGRSYIGGQGYVSTPFAAVDRSEIEEITCLEPETCEPLMNWIDAMHDVDRLAEQRSACVTAALEIEEAARVEFVRFVHENSFLSLQVDQRLVVNA